GDPVLRKVVGPDAFIAFAGAHLGFALRRVLGIFLGDLPLQQPRTKHSQRASLVLLLRALVGATDDQAGRLVNDLHGGIGGVDSLPARTGGPAAGDVEVFGLDFDVDLLGLGQDGDGAGAGVDTALGFGGGHALDAMDAAFVFEPFVDFRAGDFKDDFFIPAQVGSARIEILKTPTARLS